MTAFDTLFVGGAVFDGRVVSRATAVGLSAGRIAAVGGDELREHASTSTRIVDLDGRLLLPGFVDAHIHPIEGGLERMRCDLSRGASKDDYLALIRAYASEHPDEPWILGGGWQVSAFPGGTPLASDLDAVVGDRPVFLDNRDHHGAWVSTRALRIAELRADTPDPVDGRIERFPDDVPSGTLHEGARHLVRRHVPADSATEVYAALLAAQDYLLSQGVTGWQDAIVGNYGGHTDTTEIYLRAARDGDLKADVVAALWWDRTRGAEQIPELIHRRRLADHPRFRATTVKIMQDGIPENRTAAMISPYLTEACRCGTGLESGISFVDPIDLCGYVTSLDSHGFQVHMHAIGDRAVREGLDAFSAARRSNGASDRRHHIAHVQVVHPDDIPRFAQLDVAVNMQALWATFEPQMVQFDVPLLGEQRVQWQYPFAELWASGATLAAGSDWPVTTPDPWAAVHVAVNRRLPRDDPDYNANPFIPRQALLLEQALGAYTRGSAWINRSAASGTVETGAVADLVVADRNPFARERDEIASTRTASTWIAGEEVFSI